MSCANPFTTYHDYTLSSGYKITKYYDVPCGYCLNCRKDKQNYYIDRANYEYCKRITASFVTFTYDDINLIDRCAVHDDNGRLIYDVANNGDKVLRATLNYTDLTNFIQNIRKYIQNHPKIQNIMCQPDFSYLYCGEYGDSWNRCHFHILFFGLDFAYCKKLIFEQWKYGFIDVLPLLDGGIRYVTKYMDKQTFGYLAEEQFDNKGLARPKIRMSQGFGKGLFLDNLDDIVKHDFTYPIAKGNRRPCSQYWKSLYTGNRQSKDTTKTHRYKLQCINRTARLMKESNFHHRADIFNEQVQKEWKLNRAKNLEKNYEIQIRNGGHPVLEFEDICFNRFGNPVVKKDKLNLSPDILRFLSELYIQTLPYSDVIPF